MDVLGVSVPLWLLLAVCVSVGVYLFFTWNHGDLQAMGIPGPKPLPAVGNFHQMMKEGMFTFDRVMAKTYGKVFGYYEGRNPVIVVGDRSMLKDILVKDFTSFPNHRPDLFKNIMSKSVFNAEGEQWRHIRGLLTPSFSTGKLKLMMDLINKAADQLVQNMEEKSRSNQAFEAKDMCGGFTMDVIASTAFGLQIDSQKDPDNPFCANAKKVFMFSITNPVIIIAFAFPFLLPVLKIFMKSIFPAGTEEFFTEVINQAVEERRTNKSTRVDFLKLMMDAETEAPDGSHVSPSEGGKSLSQSKPLKNKGLTMEEIIAQSFLFFIAGFETTSNTMSFLMYHLALHPEVQQKLLEEIDGIMEENGQAVTYDSLSKMTYLDMCINETLRITPPVPRMERTSTKDAEIGGVHFKKNQLIIIPYMLLHMDPEVWPEPEQFDPDRFLPEAVSERDPCSFMPFGLGPRACIGKRLAQVEMKVAMAKVLHKFRVVKCEKTPVPLRISKEFLTKSEDGLWVKLEAR